MTGLIIQTLLGTAILCLCSIIHISILIWITGYLARLSEANAESRRKKRWNLMVAGVFSLITFSHFIQILIWAIALGFRQAIENPDDYYYFALITYTTVGYGDVLAKEGSRIFAAMSAVTGVLNFGLSTAFLVGVFSRMLSDQGKSL
jgi:hypothetical protein